MNIEVLNGVYAQQTNEGVVEHTFNYFTDLTTSSKIKFINMVTNTIVTEDAFYSVAMDIMFNFELIDIFTDIDVSEILNAANTIDCMEDFVRSTNIVDILLANVRVGLVDELRDAVNKNIAYKTGIHHMEIESAITSLLRTAEEKLSSIDVGEMIGYIKQMGDMATEITPERILQAYEKSDAFKMNVQARQDALKRDSDNIIHMADVIKKDNK